MNIQAVHQIVANEMRCKSSRKVYKEIAGLVELYD